MKKRSWIIALPLIAGVLTFSGCSTNSWVYRPDVHQGNLVTQEMYDQLQIGMSKEQVLFLLGQPLLVNEFRANRWDYVYYFNPRHGTIHMRRLSLTFDQDGRLSQMSQDPLPTERQIDEQIINGESDFVLTPLSERQKQSEQ